MMKRVSQILRPLIVLSLVTGACGNDSGTSNEPPALVTTPIEDGPDREVADDSGLIETVEELEQNELDISRADLQLEATEAPTEVRPGEKLSIDVILTSIDTQLVNAPTVAFDLPAGLRTASLAESCNTDADRLPVVSCMIAPFIQNINPPHSSDTFRIDLGVPDDYAADTIQIELSAVSSNNPVANDPDPTNNTVMLSISVTR